MWYTGGDGFGNWKLGYASSPDGIVWEKANGANPVIGTGSWYAKGPHNPSVLGPDSLGGYKMWFQGNPMGHEDVQVGYATATNETTWTVRADPVFSFGTPGSWDDDKVMDPKVLYDGQRYEMWYAGEELDGVTEVGYATSLDGLSWTRYASNPVMGRGPSYWDLADLYCLDVFFDGGMYHMWYGGRLPSTVILPIQGVGYAVSPKGMAVSVSPQSLNVGDSVWVRARVDSLAGLSFSAEIEYPDGNLIALIELYDDGMHGDSLAGDGIFANNWFPTEVHTYFVDLKLHRNTLTFEMNNAATIDVITDVPEEPTLPKSFYLGQNYPNPFNPATVIQYTVAAPSGGLSLSKAGVEGRNVSHQVRLSVYDLLGREVAVLVNEEMKPGTYETSWDAAGFPGGVYFYRLQAGNFSETRKLVLIR
jgi:hypothetical protein